MSDTSSPPPLIRRRLYALAILVALVSVAPVFFLALRALSSGWAPAWEALTRPRMWLLVSNTATLVLTVCALATLIGVLSAWMVSQRALPCHRLWVVLLCLPLAVPSFVATFTWRTLFPTVDGLWPLVLVLSLSLAPYVTIPCLAAFRAADRSLADVAQTLGRSDAHIFFRIIVPQIAPAAASGTLIIALYTLSDFGAPAMLRYDTLTTGVYAQLLGGVNPIAPAASALTIAIAAMLIVVGESRLRRLHPRTVRTGYRAAITSPSRTGAAGMLLFLSLTAGVSIVVPLTTLLVRSLSNTRYDTDWGRLVEAAATTLVLGMLAATIATIAGLPLAYLGGRVRTRFISLLEAATFTGHALPGVVLALAIVSLTITVAPVAYQSTAALVASYAILFLPKGLGSSRSGFAVVSPRLEDTARTLGDSEMRAWRHISIRGAFPHIAAGWLLIMTAVMKELPATLMLRPTGVNTLATELWNSSSLGAYGASAPAALALVVLGLIPSLMLTRNLNRP